MLDVLHNGKNITEVLSLNGEEAVEFFAGRKVISKRLKPLQDIGLG
ncbi:hypothetical protein [Neolewinella antarctica]|uniref:Excinuclease UvrABC ATPase subunit n=1 Tax=Neolewinella antarctica TaxID=442734 RepID=A0ABX0XBU3_9BACT|nr:hypothetical protein [Neolewinella antarctica]NJC26540.1 excinuclease UvrABC ATPase subunit [Neolewinella antarctica]